MSTKSTKDNKSFTTEDPKGDDQPKYQAEQNAQNPPENVEEDTNSGISNGQKPKFDRGDSAVNPGVAGPGSANAAAADYPHNPDPLGTIAKGVGDSQNSNSMSEAEWDALPAQSALRAGYSRENRPPKNQTH